ncbi:hypothetical protein ACFY1J_39215 [Streptomyces sp. NPDC001406]|uniref:hypothetical protein n=1 Tax=Streptomyces sp. NPDC001406 TaxID=3364572 RepID=UPI0036C80FDE
MAAVACFRRVDPVKSIVEIEDLSSALLVELKDIELPAAMQRAKARQAEAEREKRAKIIAAEGEALSANCLAEAADVISDHPIALQLRNLQILAEIAAEKNSTIVFPAQFLESARALTRFVEGEAGRGGARRLRRNYGRAGNWWEAGAVGKRCPCIHEGRLKAPWSRHHGRRQACSRGREAPVPTRPGS